MILNELNFIITYYLALPFNARRVNRITKYRSFLALQYKLLNQDDSLLREYTDRARSVLFFLH